MFDKLRAHFSKASLCFFYWFDLYYFVMAELRLASLNVNGARDIRKRGMIKEVIKQKNIDVIFLQETHSDVANADGWTREFEGISILSHYTSISAGVAILFSKIFSPISLDCDEIIKGRL